MHELNSIIGNKFDSQVANKDIKKKSKRKSTEKYKNF